MSESQFLTELKSLAESLGFRCWRVHQTRRKPREHIDKGFSDLVCVGHGTIVFVETKVDNNQMSVEQEEFCSAVRGSGNKFWCVRSLDEFLLMGRMEGWWR